MRNHWFHWSEEINLSEENSCKNLRDLTMNKSRGTSLRQTPHKSEQIPGRGEVRPRRRIQEKRSPPRLSSQGFGQRVSRTVLGTRARRRSREKPTRDLAGACDLARRRRAGGSTRPSRYRYTGNASRLQGAGATAASVHPRRPGREKRWGDVALVWYWKEGKKP